jgi:Protein of unknown function (DUF3168)
MTSPYTDIRAALIGYAQLAEHVADRVCLNAANESTALPYVVYRVERKQERGLDGSLHGEIITAEVQAWARGAPRCEQIADAAQDALTLLDGAIVTDRVTGYDQDTMLDYESVRVTILR